MKAEIRAMLFADVVGYSRLREEHIPLFLNHFMGCVASHIADSPYAPITKNAWGDAVYLVFRNVRDAGHFALELAETINNTNWEERGLPKGLNFRIALHAGPVYACTHPVHERNTYTGTHVSRAARLEPITPEGQVYASQAFVALAAAEGITGVTCEYVGRISLPKA